MIEINYSLTKEQSRIRIWRCGALVVMLPSNYMIAGSIRTCAAIYKVSSSKIAIA